MKKQKVLFLIFFIAPLVAGVSSRKAEATYQVRCQYTGEGILKTLTANTGPGEQAVAFGGWLMIGSDATGDGPWYYVFENQTSVSVLIASGGICVGRDAVDYVTERECPQCRKWEKWDSPYCRIYRETGRDTMSFTETVRQGEVAVVDGVRIWTHPDLPAPGVWLYVDRTVGNVRHVISTGALCIGPENLAIPHRRQVCPTCALLE